MRVFFVLILGVMFFSCRGLAQEDNMGTATSALQDVLSNLKQSVEKMGLDNDQLTARDNAMQEQITQLQGQLSQLENQWDLLNKQADALKEKNPGRSRDTERLEEENADLDNRIEKSQGGIKSIQESMNEGYQEEQKLLSPGFQASDHRQKEKLRLMKMVYESQQRQEALHQSILNFKKNIQSLPIDAVLARQQFLKQQVKDLQAQIAAYQQKSSSAQGVAQRDDARLEELEGELKALEQNYAQLKDLTEQMSKKAKAVGMPADQRVEEQKLQGSIDDLNRQDTGLRADLDDLRTQMVELDKRKSYLEALIQH